MLYTCSTVNINSGGNPTDAALFHPSVGEFAANIALLYIQREMNWCVKQTMKDTWRILCDNTSVLFEVDNNRSQKFIPLRECNFPLKWT